MSAEFSTSFAREHEQVTVHISAASDVGSIRQVNEDSYFANAPVFLVADGMGGHSYGDRASQTVAAEFNETYEAGTFEPTTPHVVLEVIDRSNAGVQNLVSAADGPGAVAGTTLAGVALVEADEMGPQGLHWMIFNIGDSRVYGWNGRSLVQITVDHSAVQEMVSMGLITAEEALVHPDRNVITRAVGSEAQVEADIWLMPTRGHQVFLVCSDGLTKELDDAQIAELILAYGADPEPGLSLAEHLVQNAVERGGRDNITVVVVESELANDDSEAVARAGDRVHLPAEESKDAS
ncbi:PP2C family protein-serine/threonine phosphatase [Pseudoclavibacter endophyticus]|uniref:Serine/threonine-protein phosphatase n=1 Tax=Pseudoclavibacter endophyticus TaxID=1778590 RepID=A0A6H9WJ51_9MICO|nr:protein phosphatase 2C domain-containing protein [Pseudoclavibacter endophyticus]KAB1649273.1 serine/threonine-protein phosphatase [Pseudoclavibacter endophyticus]